MKWGPPLSSYWSKQRTLSRRAVLATGAGIGAAVACGGKSTARRQTTNESQPTLVSTATPPTPTATPVRSGGVARLVSSRSLTFDTWDTLKSGDASTLEVLGRTHARLIQWAQPEAAELGSDLAASWEQASPTTLILRLDPKARWHDRAPLNGRAVTADDVVAHLQRARELAKSGRRPAVQRAHDYLTIDKVSSPSAGVVRIDTSAADPFLAYTLASRFALVQAPEAVSTFEGIWGKLDPAHVVGSGSWLLEGATGDGLEFTDHAAGHRRALLDRLSVHARSDDLQLFLAKQLDEVVTRDRRDAPAIRSAAGDVPISYPRFEESPVVSTFFVGAPPWNDSRLLRAISHALSRRALAERLFGGRAIAWWAFPVSVDYLRLEDTAKLPGFMDPVDALLARELWEAAGGRSLGTVTIDFPSIFDPLYSASSVVTGMLNEAIGGNQFRPAVETYTTIARKAADHRYGNGNAAFWFGWGPPFVEPEPSRWAIETYASNSPGALTTGVKSEKLDGLLTKLKTDFEARSRATILGDLAAEILSQGGHGYMGWLTQVHDHFRWPYLNRSTPGPWWDQHLNAITSVDASAPSVAGRP